MEKRSNAVESYGKQHGRVRGGGLWNHQRKGLSDIIYIVSCGTFTDVPLFTGLLFISSLCHYSLLFFSKSGL